MRDLAGLGRPLRPAPDALEWRPCTRGSSHGHVVSAVVGVAVHRFLPGPGRDQPDGRIPRCSRPPHRGLRQARHRADRSKKEADDVTEEVRGGGFWRRSVYVETIEEGWLDYDHLRTCVRFVSDHLDKDGKVISSGERYCISSLPADRLLASRWNLLLRRSWVVENECHHIKGTFFAEVDRRWIEVDPVGALVIVLLRRIAYSQLAFYRAVTLRSEDRVVEPPETRQFEHVA